MSDQSIGHLVPSELLAALKARFPLRRPRLEQTEREIFFEAGQQRLIEFLEAEHATAISAPIFPTE